MFAAACVAGLLLSVSHYAQALHTSVDVVYRKHSSSERRFALPPRSYVASSSSAVLSEIDQQGFWFANFTIGAANNQLMVIDTGSSDTIVNLGEYQPGPHSQDQNMTFNEPYGTTNPNGTGSLTVNGEVYEDLVASSGLAVQNQALGVQKKPNTPAFPNNGLVGFSERANSRFPLQNQPWIHSLCLDNVITDCRFGLAFNTNNTGTQIIGGLDTSKFTGSLSVAPLNEYEWQLIGDVTVGNKVFASNAAIHTDSGTTVIYGPLDIVRDIFEQLELETVYTPGKTTSYLRGFFPCDNPPIVGFAFPSAAQAANATGSVSNTSTNFNILGKPMAFQDNGNNNCTAALQGIQSKKVTGWLVGQAFFQGHYIDHNIANGTMGFANLA